MLPVELSLRWKCPDEDFKDKWQLVRGGGELLIPLCCKSRATATPFCERPDGVKSFSIHLSEKKPSCFGLRTA